MFELSNPAVSQSPQPRENEVRAELERILASSCFQASEKRRRFLRFVVEETLAGRANRLKGYTIAVAVFERGEDFDPQLDPVVRLEARRLRRDLDGYYAADGRNNPLHISIPKGQYAPEIVVLDTGGSDNRKESAASGGAPTPDVPKPEAARKASDGRRNPLVVRWMMASLLLCALVIAGLAYELFRDRIEKPAQAKSAHGPSLIVLPFEQRDSGAATVFLADGLIDQIMSEFNRYPDIRLYMAPATRENATTAEIANPAGKVAVDYLVSGSVSSDASTVRINAKLIEGVSDRVLWTETYDNPLSPASLLKTQKQIAEKVALALGQTYGVIRTDQIDRLPDSFVPDMSSYQCVLRAYSYRRNFSAALHAPVLGCLKEAVQRDPTYAEAWAMLGWLYLDAARFGRTEDGNTELAYDRALDAASHAVSIDGQNVLALKALSSINHYMGNFDESVRFAREALALNPNDPDSLAQLGWRLAVRGKFSQGIPYLKAAIVRTASAPGWYYHLIAIDDLMHGRYDQMLSAAKNGTVDSSGISWCLVAVANAFLGNTDAARAALDKMAEVSPRLAKDPAAFLRGHQATDEIVEAVVAGMRKAGWLEPAETRN